MSDRDFFRFILPSFLAMLLFIALPIISVGIQSLYIEHEQVLVVGESCGPFGCTETTAVDLDATQALRDAEPLGRFNGLATYFGRNHLAAADVSAAWQQSDTMLEFVAGLMDLRFYKALIFTIAYTLVVTPLTIVLGFFIALGVNAVPRVTKGPVIFFSLLPMIITPLIGSLVLFWMIDSRGIIGASLIELFDDPSLSLKASPALTWITLMVYGVWHSAPFAFIIFYAGLQTVSNDTLEAAMIDGASRWERVRYVTMPHLMPLLVFITFIQLMDNFRVFEPIIGFQASANATSMAWIIFNDLRGTDTTLFGSAATTSMLTIIFIAILVSPVAYRTWKDYSQRSA